MDTKPLAELYLDKLNNEKNPIPVLVNFSKSVLGLTNDGKLYPIMAKFNKIYGKTAVFFSILSCVPMSDVTENSLYSLITYFCKKQLAEKTKTLTSQSLMEFSDTILKGNEKITDIPNPFREDK